MNEEICCITYEGKMAKNEAFFKLCAVHRKN